MDATHDTDVDAIDLPPDLAVCHALIRQLLAAGQEQSRTIDLLRHRLAELLRRAYGRSSEKLDANQLLLFTEMLQQLGQEPPAPPPPPSPKSDALRPVKTPHGRRRFPADLPRVRKEFDLPEHKKDCPCCSKLRSRIGQETAEKLHFRPATLEVWEMVQWKYGCRHCDAEGRDPQIVLAEKPPEAIDRCMATPGLLAQVVVSKYGDHLPLHRLENIFARHDIDIARSTMCDWMAGCARALSPLYDLMKQEVLQSKVMHTDDSPVDVLDKSRQNTRIGRLWIYYGDAEHPSCVFGYTADHCKEGPALFLGNWGGNNKVYLQADAFSGYNGLYITGIANAAAAPAADGAGAAQAPASQAPGPAAARETAEQSPADVPATAAAGDLAKSCTAAPAVTPPAPATPASLDPARIDRALVLITTLLSNIAALAKGIVEVACWAHTRRKFYEARNSDTARSAQALAYIRTLYNVEKQAKEQKLDAAATAALRRQLSLPLLAQFKVWLESQRLCEGGGVLPKSPMGEAITYALNQWDALCVYVGDGDLDIDNNQGENALRRVAMGRKNWLFCGSDKGGETAAVLFSVIATCERHKVNPYQYLTDVLTRIAALPISRLAELLPHRWKAAQAAAAHAPPPAPS